MCAKRKNLEKYDILSPNRQQRRDLKRKHPSDLSVDEKTINDALNKKKNKNWRWEAC